MISIGSNQLPALLDAQWAKDAPAEFTINAVTSDSRKSCAGALFIALQGENFDGHDYVAAAKTQGALAAVVTKAVACAIPQLIVADTKLALGKLGALVKQRAQVKTVAVTGSCGKTSVKEMIAAILSLQGNTLYTSGNLNNDIGVPQTLLRLDESHKFAVVELGANHIGEIAYTTALVRPDVALVTNLTAAHLEGFGSLEGVARAKGEIFEGLSDGGVAILNLDSHGEWQTVLAGKKVVTVSESHAHADFYATNIVMQQSGCYQFTLHSPFGETQVSLNVPGRHQVCNALLASAAAMHMMTADLSEVAQGLSATQSVAGRGRITFPRPNLRLIDDSYNASLLAMKAGIDLLSSFSGDTLLIVADMAEMGAYAPQVHHELACYAQKAKLNNVLSYGRHSQVISELCGGTHFLTQPELIAHALKLIEQSGAISVLVKGANGMKMANVVKAIEEATQC
ncbi:MAG: UDP-N-acetylmuramoyl-tripeptide--D-alanyl-D-alanine ligase [Vibrionaceae bacterium]